ncbi:radical SAM protein [Candidatus Pacearchaeota archaeon]|nr:radical SAM protein [Candidatus Pacearchaeota archaeon]
MGEEKIKLPGEVNYVEAYLTLRCNFACPYCINDRSKIVRVMNELPADEWANALNRIDFGNVSLTLGGGEPTMHKEFYGLLEILRPEISVDLLTNLSFDIGEFVERVKPNRFGRGTNPAYRSIRVSYHPKKMVAEELVERVQGLQDRGFSIGIFGISHPENSEPNMQMSEVARRAGVYFFIKDFLGDYDGQRFGYFKYPAGLDDVKKQAACRTRDLLIAPDGQVYKCHRDLYSRESPVGNITDKNFRPEFKFRDCSNYGLCNPCDVKLKTNRFLQSGNCQVEIEPKANA